MARLMDEAKEEGLWALGHPKEIGGQGMPFMDYVYINEVIGRSEDGADISRLLNCFEYDPQSLRIAGTCTERSG